MDHKLKRYQRDFPYSYCLGVYPTLELLTYQPEQVLAVLLHSKGASNEGIEKIRRRAADLGIEIQENDRLVEKLEIQEEGNQVSDAQCPAQHQLAAEVDEDYRPQRCREF
ncbi:MAG: hypothetical protein ACK2TZ_09175, partial [Anaerolineales bacterium]